MIDKSIKPGDIIKESIPCYPRYIYLKIIEILGERTSNFDVDFIDCIVEEVGKKKLREGRRKYTFRKKDLWIFKLSEKEAKNGL